MKKLKYIIQKANYMAIGISALTIETILLIITFATGYESNTPLFAALILMLIGITFIILHAKKRSEY